MDDPQALLWKVEGIRSLTKEDKFTTIALGVSTFRRQRAGQAAAAQREETRKFSWLESSEAIYRQWSATLQNNCPEDIPICGLHGRLMDGTITDEDAERYWRVLLWRHRQNLWAGKVVERINPSYRALGTFRRPRKYDFGRYDAVLRKVQVRFCTVAPAGYYLPDLYIVAAAVDAEISEQELREALEDETRPGTSNDRLAPPQIPPRTSSRMQTSIEPIPVYKLTGSWDSVMCVELPPTAVMLGTIE
ncbi:hypothetical protein BGX38DRAFT_1202028 [Terfezia claveryi]|nr:hypothetical protein BGX38DRAFT_1202028 [Terfezia claveryi]